jgi:hypothetical protein
VVRTQNVHTKKVELRSAIKCSLLPSSIGLGGTRGFIEAQRPDILESPRR